MMYLRDNTIIVIIQNLKIKKSKQWLKKANTQKIKINNKT